MKRIDPYDPMRRLLKGYGVTAEQLASALGCCRETARTRMQNPADLTIHELRRLCISCGVPAEEIKGALRFGR